jgi:hypothetical protein
VGNKLGNSIKKKKKTKLGFTKSSEFN